MKYAKELDGVMQCCSLCDRPLLISYRKWKKRTPNVFWKFLLLLSILLTPKHLLDINLKTMYKICKRYEKKHHICDARCFYTSVSKIVSEKASSTFL